MSEKKDISGHENISDILEELKRSYGASKEEPILNKEQSYSMDMSDDELKEKLRMQFASSKEDIADSKQEDDYFIDEEFLAEARMEENIDLAKTDEKIEEDVKLLDSEEEIVLEEELLEQDEIFDEEIVSDEDDITFDDLVDEDDVTFDELIDVEEDDGIVLTKLDIQDSILEEEDNILTVSEEIEINEEGIAYMHLDKQMLDDNDIEEMVAQTEEPIVEAEVEEWTGPKIPVTLFPEQKFDPVAIDINLPEDIKCEVEEEIADDVISEDLSAEVENAPLDSADIDLLLQFGCQDEVVNRCSAETAVKFADEEVLESISVETEEKADKNDVRKKILSRHEEYQRSRGALLTKLALGSLLALILIIYEGLSEIFGVEFPGILSREEYFISYVLLGLQTAVLCGVIVYRQIWEGMKKLLSRTPDGYSVVSVLAIVTVMYDISILFVDNTVPFTFHFLFALSVLLTVLSDYQALCSERKCFEFYFSDVIFGKEEINKEAADKKFTLCLSSGKNSSAEKMYSGGIDASKKVFFPMETESSVGFLSAVKTKTRSNKILAFLLIPVMVFSLISGIVTIVLAEELWLGLATVLVSLFMCMPIAWTVAKWLPFDRISAKCESEGYAFAGEGSAEEYSDCDMVIFSDMHLIAKCPPSAVNLMIYDATAKEVLLGCLNAVYSKIGGPMSETFKAAHSSNFEGCKINRIARSGVEAVVGSSYSVLVGSEAFMLRYGIRFPQAALRNKDDEIFTLCVSINGRVSARIAVKYTVNEMFEMFISRLAEDGIQCAIETFDPMINAQILTRIREGASAPVNIVHLGIDDYRLKKNGSREKILFNTSGEKLGVMSQGSRFNLAVALSSAKRLGKIRLFTNLLAIGVSVLGAIITMIVAAFGVVDGFSQFFVLLYWLLAAAGFVTITFKFLPSRERYSLDRYKQEQIEKQSIQKKVK